MKRGLRCGIYKVNGASYSNGGLSARVDEVTLIGPGVPEVFEPDETAPVVELHPGLGGTGLQPYRAIPEEPGQGAGPMFGGTFIYTSDSRFPHALPIPLHDRWEVDVSSY